MAAREVLTLTEVTASAGTIDVPQSGDTYLMPRALAIAAETETAANVTAFSVTRTNNYASLTKGVEFIFTDGTSAAGFLPLAIRGGAAGTTELLTLGKTGIATAAKFVADARVGGTSTGALYAVNGSGVVTAGFFEGFGGVASGLALGSAQSIGWDSTTGASAGTQDLKLDRDAANTLAQRNSTNAQTHNHYGRYTSATDYSRLAIKHAATTLASVTGASVTATNLIPAKAKMLGVNTKVIVALGTSGGTTGYAAGTAGDPNLWGDVVGTATTTASGQADATADPVLAWSASAQDVVITAAGGNFDGTGSIYIDVAYTMTEAD